jgi:hypothetical protein
MFVSFASLTLALLPLASGASEVAAAATVAGPGNSEWRTLSNHQVFVDTRGEGHVQMGYLSVIHDNYPGAPTLSGQPAMTAERCMRACGKISTRIIIAHEHCISVCDAGIY